MRAAAALALAVALAAPGAPAQAATAPLVVDLSRHRVTITTGFSGADLLLFGAVEPVGRDSPDEPPPDLVVVVRGPPQAELIRRKDRRGGFWVTAGQAVAAGAPSVYRVVSTRPLDLIAPPAVLGRLGIGLARLDLVLDLDDPAADPDLYRAALIRLKTAQGLYGEDSGTIGMLSQRLFRTDLHLPATVGIGAYQVEVALFHKGRLISRRATPLDVERVGLGAAIHEFARTDALAYGVIAVVVAALAGWLAALVFGRR